MRIVYNPEYLFQGIPKENQGKYYARIFEFAKALESSDSGLSPSIIDRFKLKKMIGTDTIFKFYLDSDGMRCLLKYEDSDHQIFAGEPGVVLLRAARHEDQGRIGRLLDKELSGYENFIVFDADDSSAVDFDLDPILGRRYMKDVFVPPSMTKDEFLGGMKQEDGRVVYKLSEMQLGCLQAQEPVFLLGCAGSGKTLVEVCKALKNAHTPIKQGYFTFTPMLRDVAEEIYGKYKKAKGIQGNTAFHCLKDFMLDILHVPESRYFSFERFKTWYQDEKFDRKQKWLKEIGPINLWTEIRGMVKGFAGNDYFRINEMGQLDRYLAPSVIQGLIEQRILRRQQGFQGTYLIVDGDRFFQFLRTDHDNLRVKIEERDFSEPFIDEYSYLEKINSKYSQYPKETRKLIHEFVKNVYQEYLHRSREPWLDDNDLARLLLIGLKKGEIAPLDYVLVDELQDLTEMQVMALTSLASSPQNVFMSGDVSQIINPTFFKLGRIGLIFRNRFHIDLNKEMELNENYRNGESIVRITRELLDIRQKTLGVYSEDIREESKLLEKREGLPFLLECDEETFLPVIGTWLGVPKVAIIVASEETKERISHRLRVKGKTNIYTVQEVKGQEFDKIITFNIVSEHREEWKEIMSGTLEKGSDLVNRYRYYFNLLYVAITRGKNNLFMFEEERDCALIKQLSPLFEPLSERMEMVMNLKEYETEENRRAQADRHFKEEDYDRARTYFLQLDDRRMAAICSGHSFLQKGKYYEGVTHLYQFPEYHRKAYDYSGSKELLLFHLILGMDTGVLQVEELSRLMPEKSLVQIAQPFRGKSIYPRLLRDILRLIATVNEYRINQGIGLYRLKEKYHGKR